MQSYEEKVVDAFQLASTALVQYEKQAEQKKAQDSEVSRLAVETASALLQHGKIEAHEKEACIRALHDPVQTLVLFKKLASYRSAAEQAALGQIVDARGRPESQQKQASAGGYLGRRSGEEAESWRRFGVAIGSPVS